MRGLKTLVSTAVLLAGLALMPAARAQISINIGVQPVCSYGYYGYAPYACAPMGYYGSGYFYNGIFLGMGPWAGWGYGHGWGGHRFNGDGGGSYHGGAGRVAYSGHSTSRAVNRGAGAAPTKSNAPHGGARPSVACRMSRHRMAAGKLTAALPILAADRPTGQTTSNRQSSDRRRSLISPPPVDFK